MASSNIIVTNEMPQEPVVNDESRSKPSKQITKKNKSRKSDIMKKQRLKTERRSAAELPSLPDCGHCEKGMFCQKVTAGDVSFFQNCFYKNPNKVKQDIFILRHCAVSAPKRCRSKDGIQRKSMVVHYHATTAAGSLVPVCRKTFTSLLGIKYGRVQGVLNRYIQSRRVPTENRGGDRHSKKFQRKLQSICDFLSSLQGSGLSCLQCGAKRTILSPEYDMRKLWNYYNENASHDLRVVESYFRNIFIKHFNISFGIPKEKEKKDKEKDHCFRCAPKKIKSHPEIKTDPDSIINDDLDLKILEMSYPPGEHFLFAPVPSSREPIEPQNTWRCGDELEYEQTENIDKESNSVHVDIESKISNSKTNNIKPDIYNYHQEDNLYQVSQSSEIHVPVSSNTLHHIQYQPMQTHHTQLVNTNNSNLHQLSTCQSSESPNIHELHHQLDNISMHSGHNYIIHPQSYIQLHEENSMRSQNSNTSFSSLLNGHNNTIQMSSNHMDLNLNIMNNSNVTLNINTSICNDVHCNVIHLGSHYESLNDMATLHVPDAENDNNELSNANNMTMQPDYPILSMQDPQDHENLQQSQQIEFSVEQIHDSKEISEPTSNTKSLYRCITCRLTFNTRSAYYIHRKRHSESKLFECENCERKFRRRDAFEQHLEAHANTKPFKCEQCPQSFSHRINLEIHIKRHTKMSQLDNIQNDHKCYICLKAFNTDEDLRKHNERHIKQDTSIISPTKKSNKCDICQKKFTSSSSLSLHKMTHTEGKNYKCDVCHKTTQSFDELAKHVLIHVKDQFYNCEICGLGYNSAEERADHLRTHQTDEANKYECKVCGKTYRSPIYLRRHTLMHSEERPFKCTICNRGFTRQYCLERHLLYHSGMKPHQCTLCGTKLSDLRTLNNHMNAHCVKKPVECDICLAKFSFSSNLKEHKKRMHFNNQSTFDENSDSLCNENIAQSIDYCLNENIISDRANT